MGFDISRSSSFVEKGKRNANSFSRNKIQVINILLPVPVVIPKISHSISRLGFLLSLTRVNIQTVLWLSAWPALSFSGKECNNRLHVNHIMLSCTCMLTCWTNRVQSVNRKGRLWNRLYLDVLVLKLSSLCLSWTFPHVHALTLFFDFTVNHLKTFLSHTCNIRDQVIK